MKLIIFKIDETNAIILELPRVLAEAFRYDEIFVFLNQNNQNKYVLYQDFLIAGLRYFECGLSDTISGKRNRDNEGDDLGYLWNEKLSGKKLPMTMDAEGNKFWVGRQFILFDSPEPATTWLFEKNKKFWIEITPVYPWHYKEPKKGEKFITYEEFVQTYKPIALIEISRETLDEWLKRVQELLKIVEANDSKYLTNQDKT